MKDGHNQTAKENYIDIEQDKTAVAEAEACTEMVKKEEHNKVIESKKHENKIKKIKLNYDQALIDLKEKNDFFMLKKGSAKTKVIDEAGIEERKY